MATTTPHPALKYGGKVSQARSRRVSIPKPIADIVVLEKEAAYFASPERTALGDIPTSHIAKIEVRLIEAVPVVSAVA